jgi:hypothetical protein
MKFDFLGIILLVVALVLALVSGGVLLPFAVPIGLYGLMRMGVASK